MEISEIKKTVIEQKKLSLVGHLYHKTQLVIKYGIIKNI
jgi:hypothetical protein